MATRRRKGRKSARRAPRKPARAKPKPTARKSTRTPTRTKLEPGAARKRAPAARRANPERKPRATASRKAHPSSRPPARAASGAEARPAARGERLAAGVPVEVGVVVHWFPRASAAVVALSHPIHVGDTIHVRGQSTDFVQLVSSLVLEGAPVREGTPPQALGVRLQARARPGDLVYRVSW